MAQLYLFFNIISFLLIGQTLHLDFIISIFMRV